VVEWQKTALLLRLNHHQYLSKLQWSILYNSVHREVRMFLAKGPLNPWLTVTC
jgi:hypothetical protein